MAARYEVELNIASARNLKNVNWRHGDLKPYVVAWVDPAAKSSTKVAVGGDDDDPIWDEKLVLPVPYGLPLEDATLSLDVVHAGSGEGVKPLVGSVRLPLRDVLDEVGLGSKLNRTLKLKRPSGRPHGKLEVTVAVKEPARYYDAYAPPYGQASSRDYGYAPAPYTPTPYATAPPPYATAPPSYAPTPYAQPPTGYPYGGPPAGGYAYGAQQPPVAYGQEEKSKSKFGMGTGLAVGAAAGLLGGLALAEGVDYVEDKIADDVTERVEDDLAEDGGYDGDDF